MRESTYFIETNVIETNVIETHVIETNTCLDFRCVLCRFVNGYELVEPPSSNHRHGNVIVLVGLAPHVIIFKIWI